MASKNMQSIFSQMKHGRVASHSEKNIFKQIIFNSFTHCI